MSFRAAFTGTAPLTVKWFKEDQEIVSGGTYFIKKDATCSSLELQAVKPSDSARYACRVSNDAGKVDCSALLFVKGVVSKKAACSSHTNAFPMPNINLFS